jgi:hypothetical protein
MEVALMILVTAMRKRALQKSIPLASLDLSNTWSHRLVVALAIFGTSLWLAWIHKRKTTSLGTHATLSNLSTMY